MQGTRCKVPGILALASWAAVIDVEIAEIAVSFLAQCSPGNSSPFYCSYSR